MLKERCENEGRTDRLWFALFLSFDYNSNAPHTVSRDPTTMPSPTMGHVASFLKLTSAAHGW